MEKLEFTERQIQRLFGHEAAEDEDPERLKEYYFRRDVYDQIVGSRQLRVLVGHKGIGKSAMFAVAIGEDRDDNNIALLLRPDDIVELDIYNRDFLKLIRDWKNGLTFLIVRKALAELGGNPSDLAKEVRSGQILDFLKLELLNSSAPPTSRNLKQQQVRAKFLANPRINVYIDDLDRGWQGRKEDISSISAMLNAVRDISKENPGISIRIGLRSDVYFLVRTSDESTDKIEGSVIWLKWTNHEIFAMLAKRIETFFGRNVQEKQLLEMTPRDLSLFLKPVMEDRFHGEGKWLNAPMHRVIMSLIRKRPRDLVKLCTLAARQARIYRQEIITTKHFSAIFEEYSQGRLQDTINEYRSELPDIERLLMNMKPSRKERTAREGYVYKTDELLQKIDNICERGKFLFRNGKQATPKDLITFLYKVNFLTARKDTSEGIVRKYFEENQYLSAQFADFGFHWEIHPAYRWALEPDSIHTIFENLELSSDV